ncbi:hypothetical protein BOW53_06390 [Solemya pervernicosa gill symbiont]|uniref:Uncharacterized protein n=2 Tax=Gammaproteobacteria incertae sedis TaxID=118884 RepID=A0A1T2L6R0_9GAMM|nr:hypothetical protein [Candidatus Reidiella endopervernicosa]OOZ40742.1 hypothetical protein BOW53_06390 [Solemya pervernicosa gill symbiont]QKQ26429.1 hypothetical protein HUE57_09140 [Candidatus Reidiella endopervernicosa]
MIKLLLPAMGALLVLSGCNVNPTHSEVRVYKEQAYDYYDTEVVDDYYDRYADRYDYDEPPVVVHRTKVIHNHIHTPPPVKRVVKVVHKHPHHGKHTDHHHDKHPHADKKGFIHKTKHRHDGKELKRAVHIDKRGPVIGSKSVTHIKKRSTTHPKKRAVTTRTVVSKKAVDKRDHAIKSRKVVRTKRVIPNPIKGKKSVKVTTTQASKQVKGNGRVVKRSVKVERELKRNGTRKVTKVERKTVKSKRDAERKARKAAQQKKRQERKDGGLTAVSVDAEQIDRNGKRERRYRHY